MTKQTETLCVQNWKIIVRKCADIIQLFYIKNLYLNAFRAVYRKYTKLFWLHIRQ